MDFLVFQESMALAPVVLALALSAKKKGKNPLGLTSKYIETRDYRIPEAELRAAALEAIQHAGFRNLEVGHQSGNLRAQASLSIYSYGENIQVSFEATPKGSAATFVSVCVLPFQVIAWGKNKRNAAKFFRHLQVQLGKITVGH